ncbi:hypothetical protein B0J18DRAFT_416887 [Chaetomium sp. MPI-SDFR-AT-0129]|nr:hypothetical protein B0J18DRAFT_416887 [Chaetomium sp. MPI-SDFR-AT-0129]
MHRNPGIDRVCNGCYAGRSDCLQWDRGQADLSRFSRTCKAFGAILQPLVFQSFQADSQGDDSDDNSKSDVANNNYLRRVVQLTRSLIARPDLAGCLRSLSFCVRWYPGVLTPDDRQFVEDKVVSLGLPALPHFWNSAASEVEMRNNYRRQYPLVPLELALIHAPAIQYLKFPCGQDWELTILPALALQQRKNQANKTKTNSAGAKHNNLTVSFLHLHTINIAEVPKYLFGSLYQITPTTVPIDLIQSAPNLRALSLPSDPGQLLPRRDNPRKRKKGPVPQRLPQFPHLRRIHFQKRNNLRLQALGRLVAATPQLEALALQWAPVLPWTPPLSLFPNAVNMRRKRTTDLWKWLRKVRHTLRELRLEVAGNCIEPLFEPRVDGEVEALVNGQPSQLIRGRESMRDLERLEHVSLGAKVVRALWEVWRMRRAHWSGEEERAVTLFFLELFPPTVRTITFWGSATSPTDSPKAFGQFAYEVGRGGRYPNLESVLIAPYQSDEAHWYGGTPVYWPYQAQKYAKQEFARAGVHFSVIYKRIVWQYDDIDDL